MLAEDDLRDRQPVWLALSELWLDTELDARDEARIAEVLIASPYDLTTLREIYLYELAPVLGANLLAPAGVWTGFDPEWLYDRARRRASRRGWRYRGWMALGWARWLMTNACEPHWRQIADRVSHARAC